MPPDQRNSMQMCDELQHAKCDEPPIFLIETHVTDICSGHHVPCDQMCRITCTLIGCQLLPNHSVPTRHSHDMHARDTSRLLETRVCRSDWQQHTTYIYTIYTPLVTHASASGTFRAHSTHLLVAHLTHSIQHDTNQLT